jgi:hypothetical protein
MQREAWRYRNSRDVSYTERLGDIGSVVMYRMQREARRYRNSRDESYAEAVKLIGRTTERTDGAYMDVPVVGGPTVMAGASDGLEACKEILCSFVRGVKGHFDNE